MLRAHNFTCAALCAIASSVVAAAVPLPCVIADYRVTSPNEIRFFCKAQQTQLLDGPVKLETLDKSGAGTSAGTGTLRLSPTERQWVIVTTATPVVGSRKYRLTVAGNFNVGGSTVQVDEQTFVFKTSNEVSVQPSGDNAKSEHFEDGKSRARYSLRSKVELNWNAAKNAVLGEKKGLCEPLDIGSGLQSWSQYYNDTNTDRVGAGFAFVAEPGPKSNNTQLCISGLKNVLGEDVKVPDDERIKLPGAPKDKASSDFYAKVLSQAGPGARPGWAADVKLTPSLMNLGSGFFLSPEALIDIGFGKVEDTKTTNTAKFGIGVAKFIPPASATSFLRGAYVTPRIAFETDRKGHHQNLLFDFDAQLFGKGWLHSIKSQNERRYAAEVLTAQRRGDDKPDPDSIEPAKSGWQLQAFAGTEIGGALSADTVMSDDETASTTLPTFRIARLRPRLAAVFEYKRLEFTASATPRILFATEKITRERQIPDPKNPGKTISDIYVKDAQGFRPYGEVSLNLGLDRFGHVALSTTYKLGSVPPNFDYVNTVQTGIVIRY